MASDDVLDILSGLSQPSVSSPSASAACSDLRSDDGQSSSPTRSANIEWRTKEVILIRHGRSTWNEFLGAHKRAQWEEQEQKRQAKPSSGMRGVIRSMVGRNSGPEGSPQAYPGTQGNTSDLLDLGGEADQKQSGGGFWQGVRGGLKHVGNAINHAGKLNQVDHPLSVGGLAQARQLKQHIAALGPNAQAPGSSLVRCRRWYISPFLRALQTAAYALSPLRRWAEERRETLQLRVTPQANEIIQSSMSLDCQGKKGNVGFKVITRAVGKLSEILEEEEDDPLFPAQGGGREKLEELSEVTATLCALDVSEVAQTWWSEVSAFKKENLKQDDARVRSLMKRILVEDDEPVVGIIAHSILFKRILQLFWPRDPQRQEEMRAALRNGAAHDTVDPYHDKVMNCGTLLLTFRYHPKGAEIVKATFLFDGRMESALTREGQTQDPDDIEVQEYGDAPPRPASPELL